MAHLKTIMLVDDDEIIVYLTKKIVKDTNKAKLIDVFGNGSDAINYLKENSKSSNLLPDIIFLDLFMPIMNGWQFLEEYKMIKSKMTKSIEIYVISSSISQEDINKAKNIYEVSDYIIKPITKEKFISIY